MHLASLSFTLRLLSFSLSRAQQLSRRDIRGNSTIRNYKHANTFGRYSNTPPNQLPA